MQPLAYGGAVALGASACVTLCVAARRHPGPWVNTAARAIGAVLVADALSYTLALAVEGTWSATLPS